MNKLILMAALILITGGLYAQAGLFGIAYDMQVAGADSTLRALGFSYWENVDSMVKYKSDTDPMTRAIVLIVDPSTLKVAGWLVRHDPALTKEDNQVIVDRLYTLHGDGAFFDKETQQLVWSLSASRTVHAMYWSDGSLVVMYHDLERASLFDVGPEERGKATEQP